MRYRVLVSVSIVLLLSVLHVVAAQEPLDCTIHQCARLPLILYPEQPTLTPTQPPAALAVLSSRGYMRGTTYYIVGELLNGTNKPAYFVKVTATLYDAANQLIATDATYGYLTKTNTGQRNPFKIFVLNAPTNIDHYKLTLSSNSSSSLDYRPVTILSQFVRDNFGPEVFGELRNDEIKELKSIRVVATFYDAQGAVVMVDIGYPSVTTLAPGATSPYKVSTLEKDLVYSTFVVQAEGYVTP